MAPRFDRRPVVHPGFPAGVPWRGPGFASAHSALPRILCESGSGGEVGPVSVRREELSTRRGVVGWVATGDNRSRSTCWLADGGGSAPSTNNQKGSGARCAALRTAVSVAVRRDVEGTVEAQFDLSA